MALIGNSNVQRHLMDQIFTARTPINTYLDDINTLIDWGPIRAHVQTAYGDTKRGRPTRDLIQLFKGLLLQAWYNLSDPGLERALNDRLSFQRFLGLSLDEPVPDETTFWRFRNRLEETGVLTTVFATVLDQLAEHELIVEQGTLIDATIKPAPSRPPRTDRQTGETQPSRDLDATFVTKRGKTTFGYKAHIGVDLGSDLIKTVTVTPANVHDSTEFDRLLTGHEQSVFADKAYAKADRKRQLRADGVYCGILDKAYRNRPLSVTQKRKNQKKTTIRNRVERIFATWVKDYGYLKTRYTTLARNTAQVVMMSLAFNLKRAQTLLAPGLT